MHSTDFCVMVTGATGMVGGALAAHLHAQGIAVRAVVRSAPDAARLAVPPQQVAVVPAGLAPDTDWSAALAGVHCVVHCAARVHALHERLEDPLQTYRAVNVQGTLALAAQAAAAGVRRLVFVSSVKALGESSAPGRALRADDLPAPQDPYGISKLEAERALLALAGLSGMEVVIVRPPLVYGPGARANFAAMLRWLQRGWPLPLGAVTGNRRSLVALDNLLDLLTVCLHHPQAANQAFMVSDGEDVSTADLLRRLAQALGRPARLLAVPQWLLRGCAAALGQRAAVQRLCGNLQVDLDKTRRRLDWQPPLTLDQGLARVARARGRP